MFEYVESLYAEHWFSFYEELRFSVPSERTTD
jgi:hypothetical protein